MKPVYFLLPVGALVICSIWFGSQRRAIHALEEQSSLLRNKIAAGQLGGPVAAARRTGSPGAPIDWKKSAVGLVDDGQRSAMEFIRDKVRLKDQLMPMDKEELVAVLGDVASLELPIAARRELERMLIEALIDKDPAFAMERCTGFMDDHEQLFENQFPERFAEWAETDPAAAVAWFLKQIASGLFDSRSLAGLSGPRIPCEAKLVGLMLVSPPEEAARNNRPLPEDWRELIFNQAVTGSGEFLVPLQGSPAAMDNKAMARDLAARISDEALRERLLKQLE